VARAEQFLHLPAEHDAQTTEKKRLLLQYWSTMKFAQPTALVLHRRPHHVQSVRCSDVVFLCF